MDSTIEEIARIKKGLPLSYFNSLCREIDLPEKRLAKVVSIPVSTLATRKKKGNFTFPESERLARIGRIYNRAVEVFEDKSLAKQWLKKPLFHLDGIAPIEFIDTELGAMEVENLLGRIEHGVFP